jgi:superfamily II DNA or RNA helicase
MNLRYDKEQEKFVVAGATRIEYHQLNLWLTRHVKGYRFMPAFKMGVWNGQTSYFDNGKVNLGLWKECWKACKEIGVTFNIENKEDFPLNREVTLEGLTEFCKDFYKQYKVKDRKTGEWIPFMPYDYQIETAFKILRNRYCMAEVATSGGKSLVISIVIFYILKNMNPDAKFLIIVPSITLVTQFYENIMEYNYGNNYLDKYNNTVEFRDHLIDAILNDDPNYNPCHIRMEEIMSDKPRKYTGPSQPNIYIGCYQSLEKWPKEFFHQFHTVACDEAHGAKATTLTTILKRTFGHAYNRFGVSGTFPSDDTLEILTIQSVLGPKVTQIEASALVKSGTITPMEIRAVILNHATGEMNDRLSSIRKMGAGAEAYRYEMDYIQQSEKRLEFIKKMVDKCTSNTLLLFNTIEYGKKIVNKLREDLKDKEFYYIAGEIKNKEREAIKKAMERTDGKVIVLVASYGTLSTGVSINAIFNVIFADSPGKSEGKIIQSIGRALRKHDDKKIATIFDIVDVFDPKELNNTLYKHFLEREKYYKNRNYPCKVIKMNL